MLRMVIGMMDLMQIQETCFVTENQADGIINSIDEAIGALMRARAAAEELKAETCHIRSVVGSEETINAMYSDLQAKQDETLATVNCAKALLEVI